MLRLVSSAPDFFAHNGDKALRHGDGFGCQCARCGRSICAPYGFERKLIWCLYCGMEHGFVPLIESYWPTRYDFGVTLEECRENRDALLRGGHEELDRMAQERARRHGKLIDFFDMF